MIGFVILRTSSDVLWKECYMCIRRLYPDSPIAIIDDNQGPPIDISDTHDTVHHVAEHYNNLYPLYYASIAEMDVERFVIIHDTMMMKEHLDTSRDCMIWSTMSSNLDIEVELLSLFNGDLGLYHRQRETPSCYRGCYILSKESIEKLALTGVFSLFPLADTALRVEALDSIVTSLLTRMGLIDEVPLIGAIEDHPYSPSYNIGEYVLGMVPELPLVHIMSTSLSHTYADSYLQLTRENVYTMLAGTDTLCLFATYNTGPLSDNTILYINELASLYDTVIVLATGSRIDVSKIDGRVRLLYCPNKNYDFGMWSRIVVHIDPSTLSELALINDSCLIVRSITNTVTYIRNSGERFTGITDNYDKEYHIQSYFLVFRGYACIDRLREFFLSRDMEKEHDYSSAVLDYETKLTSFMKEIVDVRVLYPIENIHILRTTGSGIKEKVLEINQYNSAWMLWDVLLAIGCPLLKRKRFKSIVPSDYQAMLLKRFGQSPYLDTIQ